MSSASNINTESSVDRFILPEDRLYQATRCWLIWLQGLFASRPIGRHRWNQNPNETEILITDQSAEHLETTNKRPIIVTSRGPAQWMGISRDQVLSRSFDGRIKVIADSIGCTMTISCIAREGVEAQELAYIIFRMIPVFKPSIQRLGNLHAIGNQIGVSPETQQGAIIPGSSTPEWKMVRLTVPFYLNEIISTEEEGFHTVMRAVNLHMGLEDPGQPAATDTDGQADSENDSVTVLL